MSRKLRVLCLHGYTQNATVFHQRTGSFRSRLKKLCDFHYLDAPLLIDPTDANGNSERTWWRFEQAADNSYTYHAWDESVEAVRDCIVEHGPFDGLMGFSQGGAFATLLSAMPEFDFKFVISISGFVPRDATIMEKYFASDKSKIETPTLLVYGKADTLITPEKSESVKQFCTDVSLFEHNGGHFVCGKRPTVEAYASFLTRFQPS